MKPFDGIGSIEASSVQSVEGYPSQERGKTPQVAGPERATRDAEALNERRQAEREQARRIADHLNRTSRVFDRRIHFEVPSDSREVIVKIVDRETGHVIRQIPPAELVKLAKQMDEICETIFSSKL
ncbi:MAG: flagellar protein FlaG [Deltaproteobacteria bacterium]|nr:flagellar protein FlaG [Deltaproteobacteria bacterium]